MGSKEIKRYTTDLAQDEKSFCKSWGNKGHYPLMCSKEKVSYVIKEYEIGSSKYLHGLCVAMGLQNELLW